MKTLYLLRHAQTETGADVKDRDRPLTPRGKTDAQALGAWMSRKSHAPDQVLCSPALRTRQTLEGLLQALPAAKAAFIETIYDASAGALYEIIQNAAGSESLLLIGHNPGIHALAAFLARDDGSENAMRLTMGYSSGTLCIFECPVSSWRELMPGENRLNTLVSPERTGEN